MTEYLPGSFFLTSISGPTGWAIGVGQALAGSPSRFEHAGIVLDTDGTVLEAEPGGARLANLSEYAGRPLLVSDAPVQSWLAAGNYASGSKASQMPREAWIRGRVVAEAREIIGVGYSALDYAALAALHLHLPSKAIRERVQSSGHMICSQLCDAVYLRAGIHLYNDGRLPGDVLPADLADYAEDWATANA